MASYIKAVQMSISEEQQAGELNGSQSNNTNSSDSLGVGLLEGQLNDGANLEQKQAEAMFKIDFFEFYTFLERYITTCLSTLNIYVSSVPPRTNVNGLRFITNPEWAKARAQASHAFHANLLDALAEESCPLHKPLGNPEVRTQLGIAKDYRNAWKEVGGGKTSDSTGYDGERKNVRLQDLDLSKMLELLVTGCRHAHEVVLGHSEPDTKDFTSKDFEPQAYHDKDAGMDVDAPFESMDDAMDLD